MKRVPLHKKMAVGKRFGEFTVCGRPVVKNLSLVRYSVPCVCSCGEKRVVDIYNLVRGKSKTCGHDSKGKKEVTLNGVAMTRREFAAMTKYKYNSVVKMLHSMTPEEIVSREKHKRKSSNGYRSKIVKDFFGFGGMIGLARHLGVTRQCIYQKYKNGKHLELVDGVVSWVKNKK